MVLPVDCTEVVEDKALLADKVLLVDKAQVMGKAQAMGKGVGVWDSLSPADKRLEAEQDTQDKAEYSGKVWNSQRLVGMGLEAEWDSSSRKVLEVHEVLESRAVLWARSHRSCHLVHPWAHGVPLAQVCLQAQEVLGNPKESISLYCSP